MDFDITTSSNCTGNGNYISANNINNIQSLHPTIITLHTPTQEGYVINSSDFEKMKDGVGIVNTARGSVLNEVDLIKAIESGKVQFAGLDVYENEPNPEIQLLMNPKLSLTPHIGASTIEAQDRIGLELAKQILELLR